MRAASQLSFVGALMGRAGVGHAHEWLEAGGTEAILVAVPQREIRDGVRT